MSFFLTFNLRNNLHSKMNSFNKIKKKKKEKIIRHKFIKINNLKKKGKEIKKN